MKMIKYLTVISILTAVVFIANGFAQDSPKSIKVDGAVNDIKYSPDGTLLAVATPKGLWLYDAKTLIEIEQLMEHGSPVSTMVWVNEKTLASGGEDGTVWLWNVTTGELLNTFKDHEIRIGALVYLPVDEILASASNNEKVLWQSFNNGLGNTSIAYQIRDNFAHFSDNRKTVYTTVGLSLDGFFAQAQAIKTVKSLSYSTTYENIQIFLWNMSRPSPQRISTTHTNLINALAFSPEGNTLASGSADKTICLHDTNTGELLHRFEGHRDSITALTYSPIVGFTLASGSANGTIKTWDTWNKNLLRTYEGHTDKVAALAFTADGTLASGSKDGTVLIWENPMTK